MKPSRHMRTLERRIEHLQGRVQGHAPNTFDRSELGMLLVMRTLYRTHLGQQTGQEYSTAFLLEEAAAHLDRSDPTLRAEELVVELRTRARLLEVLAEPEPEEDADERT